MKKNIGLLIVMIFEAIFILAGIVTCFYGDFNSQCLFNLIAFLAATFYLVFGYKKKAQLFFKIVLAAIFLKEVVALVNMAINESIDAFSLLLIVGCILSVFALLISTDFGKARSYVAAFCYFACAIGAFSMVMIYIETVGGVEGVAKNMLIIYNLSRVILSTILAIMVWAKYNDKKIRKAEQN